MNGNRGWLVSYVTLALIWGCSFAFIQQALTVLTPLQVTAARMSLGAVTLVLFLAVTGSIPRPSATEWRHLLVLGTVGLAAPFALIAFAQTRVTSILAGLLNAATPLFAALFVSALIPAERPDRTQLVGLLTGFAGISVLIGVWNLAGSGTDLIGVAAMIGATICYGFGTAFSRVAMSSSALSGPQLSGVQLVLGAATVSLVLVGDPGEQSGAWSLGVVLSILALGVLGTGVAMAMFWRIIRDAGSTIAATVTYVIPVVSTTVGVLLLKEALSWNEVLGGLIVIGGVVLTQWTQLHRAPISGPDAA